MNKKFLRFAAFCILSGAILLSAGYPLRTDIDKKYIDALAGNRALFSTLLVGGGSLLFLFGLPAFFFVHKLYTTNGGITASALCFMGCAGFHLGTLALYFVTPVLVEHSAATRNLLYSDEPPFPLFALFWAFSLLMFAMGLIWMGIKGWKSTGPQPWASLLFTSGALVFLCAPLVYFPLIKLANTLVMGGFVLSSLDIFVRRP